MKSIIAVAEGAKVETVNAQGETTITGNGNVASVIADANNVRVDTIGTVVNVGKGVSGVIAGGNPVEGGSTITTALDDSSTGNDVDNDVGHDERGSDMGNNIDNEGGNDNNDVPADETPGGGTPGGGTPGGGTPGGGTPGGGTPGGADNGGSGNNGGNNGGSGMAEEQANQAIATAKGLIPSTFTANEEVDDNLITSLNNIIGMAATGVALSISNSSNGQIAADGKITYGDFNVTGDVTISISKPRGATANKTISVTVPATQHIPDDERIISGTISLPNGEMAPGEGMPVNIKARAHTGSSETINVNKDIIIPGGQNSIEYSLRVPVNTGGSGYQVSYSISGEYDYVRYGFYSTEGTIYDIDFASLVDVSDGHRENINLEIIPGAAISGTISLPDGHVAPEGRIQVTVQLTNDNGTPVSFIDDIYFYEYVNIPEGQDSVSYSVPVVANISYTKYTVSYFISSGYSYVRQGYYSTGGTTPSISASSLVDVGDGGKSGINLDIIEANLISGTISLPGGETAPEDGMGILVAARQVNPMDSSFYGASASEIVKIPGGVNSINYSIPVPANSPGTGYMIEYSLV